MENNVIEATVHTNNINNYSVSELNYLRDYIENLDKFNQVEILRILSKYTNVTLNENKYGIHVNLSELDKKILDEITIHLKYIKSQEQNLDDVEKIKDDYRNFLNCIKDNSS